MISCYKPEIDNNQAQITQLNSEISQLKNEIARLSSLVSQSEGKVSALQSEISSLKSQIASLNSSITSLEEDIQFINSDLEELNELLVLFDSYLKEVLSSFESLVTINEDSIGDINSLVINISRNVEVIEFVSSYLSAITDYQNSSLVQTDEDLQELNSLISDLKSLLTEFSKVQNITSTNLKISLLGDIKVRGLLKDINYIDWGEGSVPGTINADCNWVRVWSDSRNNLVSALHPKSNTLLLTHHSPLETRYINSSENDNVQLLLNFLESPKSVLYVSSIPEFGNSAVLNGLRAKGHKVDFLRIAKERYGLGDYSELSETNLDEYQAIIFYDGVARPSEEIIQNLKGFIENPTKKSLVMGLGWVWTGYRSVEQNEPYPINDVFESLGAKFNDWLNNVAFNVNIRLDYYPETYNGDIELCE